MSPQLPPISDPGAPELFLLDGDPSMSAHIEPLRDVFRVTTGATVAAAAEYLRRTPSPCQFLVSDVSVNGEETFDVFRTAKTLHTAPTILVTTSDVDRVPDALISGADAVLLKPFQPNLLFSRLGRLRQDRTAIRHDQTEIAIAKMRHGSAMDSAFSGQGGIKWPLAHCPHCNSSPVTSFDVASRHRAWFACLACKKVWIAKHVA